MARGRPIDINGLHRRWFRKADRLGRIRIIQRQVADEMQLAPETVCRVLSKMVKEGRIKRIRSEKNNVGVYAVKDPAEWAAEQEPAEIPEPDPTPALDVTDDHGMAFDPDTGRSLV